MKSWLKWLDTTLTGLALLTLGLMLRHATAAFAITGSRILVGAEYLLLLIFLIYLGLQLTRLPQHPNELQRRLFDLAIFIPLALSKGEPQVSASLIIFRQLLVVLHRFLKLERIQQSLERMQHYPARTMAGSFLLLIGIGTLLLSLPFATESGEGTPLIDALFTATSATCVTGLIVVDTPHYFSTFGELVILLLIQAGGLGIMALSASASLLLGKRMALGQRMIMQNLFEESDYEHLKKIILYIIRFTFATEFIGAVILFSRFQGEMHNTLEAAYYSLFHSISAFCNAGFALWSNSLEGFVYDPIVTLTMSALIILGGIGFTVVGPLLALPHLLWQYRFRAMGHLSLHSRLVIVTTAALLVIGTVFFLLLEHNHAFAHLSPSEALLASFFHSVTARTAGFNTINMGTFHIASIFFFTILMFVGASPGSCGGGIKTTTLSTLVLTARSMIKRRKDVELFHRRIPDPLIIKAISIVILSLAVIPVGVLALLVTEQEPLRDVLFEVISAFGTVGLSMGLTPKLTLIGKLFISIIMLIGRLGPLTVAITAGEGDRASKVRYPKGDILVG